MEKKQFAAVLAGQARVAEDIRQSAWTLHERVGQTYDDTRPYGFHLSMVADAAMQYGAPVVADASDVVPLLFGAYYHDSIEDARLTYNDVRRLASSFMTEPQALMATEIVYALTNEKGRTRAERANDRYYAGIRTTPYAPLVKLCDRFANMSYSFRHASGSNHHMRNVYEAEWPHFLQAIDARPTLDGRLLLPPALTQAVENLLAP